jgi:hypothetical protein
MTRWSRSLRTPPSATRSKADRRRSRPPQQPHSTRSRDQPSTCPLPSPPHNEHLSRTLNITSPRARSEGRASPFHFAARPQTERQYITALSPSPRRPRSHSQHSSAAWTEQMPLSAARRRTDHMQLPVPRAAIVYHLSRSHAADRAQAGPQTRRASRLRIKPNAERRLLLRTYRHLPWPSSLFQSLLSPRPGPVPRASPCIVSTCRRPRRSRRLSPPPSTTTR